LNCFFRFPGYLPGGIDGRPLADAIFLSNQQVFVRPLIAFRLKA